MPIKLSVIIPCYNERKRLQEGLEHYLTYLKKQKYGWELILVNDGSKDNTLNLMNKIVKKEKCVKVETYKENQGKGHAIKIGVKRAKGDIVLFSDLDHSVPISTVESFFKYFDKGASVVIGSRRVKGSKFIQRQSKIRESLGQGFTFLVRLLIDWKIKDATCGFKAFKQEAAKKLFQKITIYGWAFDAELLFLCKKYCFEYIQAPVSWRDVKGSKVSVAKDLFGSFWGLVKVRINDFTKKY